MFLSTLFVLSSLAFTTPAQAAGTVNGQVTETMDVEQYTYMKLKTDGGETWAAVPKTKVKVGDKVGVENSMEMTNFESKSLKRKFDKILFGTLAGADAAAAAYPDKGDKSKKSPHGMGMGGAMGGMMGGSSPHGQAEAKVDLKKYKTSKADGTDAYTVEELYTKKKDLKDKPITVKGQVAKYMGGVMGKNWLHVRDGSGKVKENNFDVTIATADQAKVGDTVTVKGVLHTDRDIGAGYFYPVLIEDAKVTK
jgi:hypothetical protein